MKSIVYILITALICSILSPAFPNSTSDRKHIVEIQSVHKNPDAELLNKSCLIIKKRLNDYGVHNSDVSINSKPGIIRVTLPDDVETGEILPLLISNGKTEFYETYDRTDIIKLLEKENGLLSLLNIPPENDNIHISEAILGYCKPEIRSQVDAYITRNYVSKPGEGIKFLWSKSPDRNGEYSLYLLKQNPVLDRSQILEASAGKIDESNELMIKFNEKGALIWQDLSENNIGKSIAMVIDNMVYFAPVLKSEIRSGKCSVTGDFTLNEVTQLKSLINNGELPLDFKIAEK